MGVKSILVHADHTHSNVGAMVGDTLKIRNDILQNKPQLDGTLAFSQTLNMALFHFDIQSVDYLLKRLNQLGSLQIPGCKRIDGRAHDIVHRIRKDIHLLNSLIGEFQFLIMHLLGRIRNVYCMIGDALKIVDTVKQNGQCPAVRLRQITVVQLDQIGSQHILVVIHILFHTDNAVNLFLIIILQVLQCKIQRISRFQCHLVRRISAKLHGKCGTLQKPLIQNCKLVRFLILFTRFVRYGLLRQLHQKIAKRIKKNNRTDVKNAMDCGDSCRTCRLGQKFHSTQGHIDCIEYHKKYNGSDQIKIQMDHGCSAGILAGSNRGDQCCGTGSDILSHDDRHCCAVRHDSGGTQRLQDSHRRG